MHKDVLMKVLNSSAKGMKGQRDSMGGRRVGVRKHIVEEVEERGRGGVGKHKYIPS